jgi:hypothetical protein
MKNLTARGELLWVAQACERVAEHLAQHHSLWVAGNELATEVRELER